MNKIIYATVLSCFIASFGFSQQSTKYRKIIENNSRDDCTQTDDENTIPHGSYNFDSKTDIEMLFSETSMPGSNIFCLLHSKVRTDCEF